MPVYREIHLLMYYVYSVMVQADSTDNFPDGPLWASVSSDESFVKYERLQAVTILPFLFGYSLITLDLCSISTLADGFESITRQHKGTSVTNHNDLNKTFRICYCSSLDIHILAMVGSMRCSLLTHWGIGYFHISPNAEGTF